MIVQEGVSGPAGYRSRTRDEGGAETPPSSSLDACDYGTVMVVPSPVAVIVNVPAVLDA